MKALVFALVTSIAVSLFGCSRREQSRTEAIKPMQLIKKTGAYELGALGLTLHVFKDAQGRIDYTVADASGRLLLQAKRKFNPGQQWGMVFDLKQRLWVHSSDAGTVVWEMNDAGAYSEKIVTQEDAKEMPKPLFDILPTVLKKKWASSRP